MKPTLAILPLLTTLALAAQRCIPDTVQPTFGNQICDRIWGASYPYHWYCPDGRDGGYGTLPVGGCTPLNGPEEWYDKEFCVCE
ncbi:hypothetical protein Tdes44962_MAKER07781 [Teratosphaeria destructans]|uniref:Uncharacterized protein n=1 Tax=Teratosphaeria destructans TaxID=418781 RepID=A0A9W7SYE4_9PEZI|nr:hypothetical protein Tdes44962_MAKER07781 [Teratosphaeria destructans]